MANMKIEEVEGIGPTFGEKLRTAGITNTDTLLEKGCTPSGRKEMAEQTGLDTKQLLKWVNMADLFRIKGVGSEFAELLERSGVDTVKELGTRNAENLAAKIEEVNTEKKLTRVTPSLANVTDWIDQAKGMPGKVEY